MFMLSLVSFGRMAQMRLRSERPIVHKYGTIAIFVTVAILAQGTSRAVAVTQAFLVEPGSIPGGCK